MPSTLRSPSIPAAEIQATFAFEGTPASFTPSAVATAPAFSGSALSSHSHNLDTVIDEVVTISSGTGTLANLPAMVQSIYATAGLITGPLILIPIAATLLTGLVKVDMSTGVITCFSGNLITQVKVTYMKKPTVGASGGTPSGSVAAPTVTVNAASYTPAGNVTVS